LSIGINLYVVTPAEDSDPDRVRQTLETLHKMGFLKGGKRV